MLRPSANILGRTRLAACLVWGGGRLCLLIPPPLPLPFVASWGWFKSTEWTDPLTPSRSANTFTATTENLLRAAESGQARISSSAWCEGLTAHPSIEFPAPGANSWPMRVNWGWRSEGRKSGQQKAPNRVAAWAEIFSEVGLPESATILPQMGGVGTVTLTASIWQPRNLLMNMLHAKVLAVFNGEDTFLRAVGVGAGAFDGHGHFSRI